MSPPQINHSTDRTDACAVDNSCPPESGCCAGDAQKAEGVKTAQHGAKLAVLAVLCAVACLTVPLAAGGVAVATGALAGRWWIAVLGMLMAAVAGVAMVRRRDGSGC